MMKKLSEIEITEEMKEKASKCTTAEELTALALEYDLELTQEEITETLKYNLHKEVSDAPKELSDDDLDHVSGGFSEDSGSDKGKCLPPEHKGVFIDKYASNAYVGKMVYLVNNDNPQEYWWGILTGSYEKHRILWLTFRIYDMLLKGQSRNNINYVDSGGTVVPLSAAASMRGNLSEIRADYVSMFEYRG